MAMLAMIAKCMRAVADVLDPQEDKQLIVAEGRPIIFRLDGHPYAAILAEEVGHG